MKNKQNEVLTAVKVLIENKMYNEAMELINASMLPESLFTTYTGDPNDPNRVKIQGGGPFGPVHGPSWGGGPGFKYESVGPSVPFAKRCIVCGDPNGHGGMQCPSFSTRGV